MTDTTEGGAAAPETPPRPATDDLALPPTRRGKGRIWAALTGLLLVAGIAGAVWIAWPWLPPLAVMKTYGRIYVESPEVYTRERLVNDRYRQDFWLRAQLDALDESDALIGRSESSGLWIGPAGQRPKASSAASPQALAFREEFLLRAALRDKIRQLVLENLLDDRHDLTGNSIYGLKFDTGIIPGSNTFARPYVKVTIEFDQADSANALQSPRFLVGSGPDPNKQSAFERNKRQFEGWIGSLETRLRIYADAQQSQPDRTCKAGDGVIDDALTAKAPLEGGAPDPAVPAGLIDVAPAPGSALGPAAPAPAASEPDAEPSKTLRPQDKALIKEALQYVMGVDPREIDVPEPTDGVSRVTLPGGWGEFFDFIVDVSPTNDSDSRAPFLMKLDPFPATVHLVRLRDWIQFQKAENDPGRFLLWQVSIVRLPESVAATEAGPDGASEPELGDWAVLVPASSLGGVTGSTPSAPALAFARSLTQEDLARMQSWVPTEVCVAMKRLPRGPFCRLNGYTATINAPVYRFVKERGRTDAYSYAVFPRGDVDGILADRAEAAATPELKLGGVETGLAVESRASEARADPIVVNFANNKRSEEDEAAEVEDGDEDNPVSSSGDVQFGWAVVEQGQQRPRQVSQMVLVSVPAYLERLDLVVETGWLDRESDPISDTREETRMEVSLPTDFEALDTLVARGARREGPVIDQSHFDREYCGKPVIAACGPADILIPGARLWRSTTVTLGGQQAGQITVTPDMQGIIASFDEVRWPQGAQAEYDHATVPLVVWTSEGSARLRDGVEVSLGTGYGPGCKAQ